MTINKSLTYGLLAISPYIAVSCSPDDETFHNISEMTVDQIDHIELIANHNMLLADGKAEIELYPRLYTADNNQIPDSRIKDEWLQYIADDGTVLNRHYSTSDASLIGRTINASLKINGTNLTSNQVSFTVIDPMSSKYSTDITIPVIFHIIQTNEDVESYGGAYKVEQIEQVLRKLNYMLSGAISANPVGVDTHIRLTPAIYDPDGNRMIEQGINRLTVSKIDNTNYYQDFLSANQLIWPAEHYLNIWLISDRAGDSGNFDISGRCTPAYLLDGATDVPEGLSLVAYTGQDLTASQAGILYKLQELDNIDRDFEISHRIMGYNEIGYYFGHYLGLMPTCNYITDEIGNDYCDDTINYFSDPAAPSSNHDWYKLSQGCYFRSENIMDDPTGGHCSVSRDQAIRMRWVLNNCAGRQAWKSTKALQGF